MPSKSSTCPRNGPKRRQEAPKTARCAPAPRNQARAVSSATWLKTDFRGHLVHPQPPTFYGVQASESPNETRRAPYQWSLGGAGGPAHAQWGPTVGPPGSPIYIVIVIVIVITTYHAVYWSYRAFRADRWFLPRSIPWVPGLPEVAHSMTEDPEDRGYRSTRLWGQWRLQSVSISNGDGRRPVCSPGVRGQGTAMQQHRNKQKAKASPSGAKRQPRHKAARMRRSKSGLSVVCVPPPPW